MGSRSLGSANAHRPPFPGFTLIEVLVVVAIIALLLSILLPSLSRAREQSKAVACAANLAQLCRAESAYQTGNQEWIPGSPWTTGYSFLKSSIPWNANIGRFATGWMDYATPLRAQNQKPGSIPRDRDVMRKLSTEDYFACPSNPHTMSWGDGTSEPAKYATIKAVSYMTMYGIMSAGPGKYLELHGQPSLFPWLSDPDAKPGWVAQSSAFDVVPPSGYVPRHSRLGRPQAKVFLADGLRFYDPDTQNITFTTNPRAAKGISQATPPSTAEDPEPAADIKGREYNLAREFSYRHGARNRINVGCFDGHVESLMVDFRGLPPKGVGYQGKAVNPQYYYPSGSVVKKPGELHKSNMLVDTVLP